MELTEEKYRSGLTPRESFLLATLARHGKAVFSVEDAANALGGEPKKVLHALAKKKWLLRLKRGLYAIVPLDVGVKGADQFIVHDFVIAAHIVTPYYIGFWSALNHHGLTDQVPRTVFIACRTPKTPVKVLTSTFLFIQLANSKFFGLERTRLDGIDVTISSKEKTLVDCLDHPEHAGGVEEVAKAIFFYNTELNFKKVRAYGLRMRNVTIFKRLGLILEACHLLHTYADVLEGIELTKGYSKLDTIAPRRGRHNERWKLLVNTELVPERWLY